MRWIAFIFAFIACTAPSSPARADEDLAAAQKFFEAYVQAGYNYDKALFEMYAPEAVNHVTFLAEDGTPSNVEYNAEQIKKSLQDYVNEGSKLGITIRFEKASYAVTTSGVRVTATADYQHLCYRDELYAALLTRVDKGEYKIKEEFARLPKKSQCKKP
jgi:hypothetical protein